MATTMMSNIEEALASVISNLSDGTYGQLLAKYHFLFELGQTNSQLPLDLIFDTIWNHRWQVVSHSSPLCLKSLLILHFTSDAELDDVLSSHSTGLGSRLCGNALEEFFDVELGVQYHTYGAGINHLLNANFIAHGANLGHIRETTIHKHILQLLTSSSILYNHQVDALCIFFKIAGATFDTYTEPSVVDCCFELLKGYNSVNPRWWPIQVSQLCVGSLIRAETFQDLLQEVIQLRECGWDSLPPPPVFTIWGPEQMETGHQDPSPTPIATHLGLPSADLEPQPPSIDISTQPGFTTLNTSEGESPICPGAITPHDTFYLEDGNVEVLCGSTLFCVHTSTLSFHSPTLRQIFIQANLATAESPNGCPRILFSDLAMDFTTLLKMIYLPGYITLPLYQCIFC